MRKNLYIYLVAFLLTLHVFAAQGSAQPSIPPEGLKAEMSGEWEKAIEVYKSILKQDPGRADLWLRISDIEARLGDQKEAIAALEEAARLAPDGADIHYRLSKAYAEAGQPVPALSAIERAVELEPDNVEYLKTHAQLANWVGKSDIAADSYERILSLTPDDDTILLNVAESSSWSGRLDRAVSAYKEYIELHPEEKEVYIEYAKTESWRGNYSDSLDVMENYRERFGESRDYLGQKARVLAWARRPSRAMELISPLLDDDPDDYDVNYSHTIALHYANRPRDAVESLEKLFELSPDSKETEDIRRFVMTPLRSNVALAYRYYTDSDDMDHHSGSIRGVYSLRPETRLESGGETDYLYAEKGSGLERVDGGKEAWHNRGWLGIYNRFSPQIAMDGDLGVADAEGTTRATYGIGLDYDPQDNLDLRLENDYGFYVVSPRAVDLGIWRNRTRFQLGYEPDLLHTVILDLGYDFFSDDHERWEVALSPRRSLLRLERFNLDGGLRGWWFGFNKDLNNGYYDPDFYQSYHATTFGYWKISDDDGISVALDAGVLKDDDMGHFRFGWGGNIEGTFGLYRDVMLKVGGGTVHNFRQEGGAFRAYMAYVALTIRF